MKLSVSTNCSVNWGFEHRLLREDITVGPLLKKKVCAVQ